MSSATENTTPVRKDGQIVSQPVLADTRVLSGVPVFLKLATKMAYSNDGTINTLTNGDIFMGISTEESNNIGGASSDIQNRMYAEGNFLMTFSDVLTQASVGADVYVNDVTDNSVVTITSDSGNPQATIGKIEQFASASTAYVRLATQITVANGA